ncbi:MAG: redoxin domain-containing protein [Myxococcales bacterium]|nr:redoxin domain-containing protein [Myxococcales bacterium]
MSLRRYSLRVRARSSCSALTIAALLGLASVGCGSDAATSSEATDGASDGTGDSTDGAADGAADGTADGATDGTEASDGTDGADGSTVDCTPTDNKAKGFLETSGGIIYYHNQPVAVRAAHDPAKGCVNQLGLDFSIDGGCKLTLDYTTLDGNWILDSASFHGDAKCGEFWPEGDTATFRLESGTIQRTALADVVTASGKLDAGACSPTKEIRLLGHVDFFAPGATADTDRRLTFGLNELKVTGAFDTEVSASSGCPASAKTCVALTCGPDYFGVDCGACDKGLSCIGGTCVEGGCDPESTGRTEGFHIGEQDKYLDEEGALFSLHSLCGAPAVWMIRVAHWCPACTYLAPDFQKMYDAYAPLGVKFILLVGETNTGGGTTSLDAKSYELKHGYQEGWISLADPHWGLTEQIIETTSDGIPSHLILDQDLVLRQSSTNTDFVWAEEAALRQILQRQGLLEP